MAPRGQATPVEVYGQGYPLVERLEAPAWACLSRRRCHHHAWSGRRRVSGLDAPIAVWFDRDGEGVDVRRELRHGDPNGQAARYHRCSDATPRTRWNYIASSATLGLYDRFAPAPVFVDRPPLDGAESPSPPRAGAGADAAEALVRHKGSERYHASACHRRKYNVFADQAAQ
jgi:hypothetical protein